MGSVKFKLKGHESFILRDGWLTKGLRAVTSNNRVFSENSGADALGVGTNMAKAIRYWMRTAGLSKLSASKQEELTELGKLLLDNDVYFEDLFSLEVVHANIVSNFEAATSWNLFFNCIPVGSSFTRDELYSMMKEAFIEKTGEIDPTERSLRDDCSAILSMYGKQEDQNSDPEEKKISPFEPFMLISKSGHRFEKRRASIERIHALVILYLIVERLNSEGSIQIDDLTDADNMPGKVFNLNRISVNSFLDELQRMKFIEVNRTAGLDIIYPKECKGMTKEMVVQRYYHVYGGKV